MSTATIIKVCVILAGLGIMAVTFVLHAKKKLTINLAVTWELLGLAAILSGAVPKFSGWSSRLSLGSLAVLLLTGFLVVWGMYHIPPIQCVKLLQNSPDLLRTSTSVRILAPVVVKPDIVSNKASI